MAKFRFESENHLFFYCRKIVLNKGVESFAPFNDAISSLAHTAYQLNGLYESEIFGLRLREPISVLTYELRESSVEDLKETTCLLGEILDVYKSLIKDVFPDNQKVESYVKEKYSLPLYSPDMHCIEEFGGMTISDELLSLEVELKGKHGIYFLYNSKKKLIYVGKSAVDLGSRLPSSIRERKAYHFSYALTKTASDTGVYEMYYIATLKPELNVEGKFLDELTIKLPELTKSEIKPVFSKNKKA